MRKFLKPVLGAVHFPDRPGTLPADGAWVEIDGYWARRLRDGDVVEAQHPLPATEGDEQIGGGSRRRGIKGRSGADEADDKNTGVSDDHI